MQYRGEQINMRIILYLLLLTVLLAAISVPLSDAEPIIFEWLDYHIEISAILAIPLLLVFFLVTFLVTYFLIFLKNIPSSLHKYYQEKQNHQSLLLLLDGFAELYTDDLNKIKQISKKLNASQNNYQLQLIKPLLLLFISKFNQIQYKNDINYEETLEDSYKNLLNFDKTKMIGLKGLIGLIINQKRYHEALSYAEKAFALQTKTEWLLKDLLKIYRALEIYDKAEKIINKLANYDFISKDGSNILLVENFISHANYCITHSKVNEATDLLEKALKIDSANIDAVIILARFYAQDNDRKAAYKVIEKAWKKSPSLDLAKFMLSIHQDYPLNKKIQLLEKIINFNSETEEAYLVLAELYIEENMLPQAREIMDKLLELHAPNYNISKLMALIETKSQNKHAVILNWLNKL